jgi:hypothetical protein
MSRFSLIVVMVLGFTSVVRADLRPRKDLSGDKNISNKIFKEDPAPKPKQELVITDKTLIELDGKSVRYADIPKNAEVILLDIANDRKTVLKIHFRTKK